MKQLLYVFTLVTLLVLVYSSGCTATYNNEMGFRESSLNDSIPIPEKAKKVKDIKNPSNDNIKKGVTYRLNNIGGDQGITPPENYFEELKNHGWIRLKQKQMGHVNFFKNGDQVIAIEIHEDTLDIYELKEDAPY
ncbi:hypothetical protein [Pontibacillus marinus]|uniref:Uncharacterized protein n=1 Tax=Pontibacillus marinus BH030004 = DSM 16465 TaxID=1385511 RepID=A0A0A5GL63_9BACI|nr:hypothetical protein [Pontibacillus marinus]KGX91905.1 hypothetical protein N783_00930 [Pontibacillus marinus BH030004 = DSM 16465]